MGTTTHYTRMYVCSTQEINALCILSLDNTNAFQDQHSVVSCTFFLSGLGAISAQNIFQEFFEDFTAWFHVEKTFRGKTQEELMSVKVQKKNSDSLCVFAHKNMSFTGKHPCDMMELLRASSIHM